MDGEEIQHEKTEKVDAVPSFSSTSTPSPPSPIQKNENPVDHGHHVTLTVTVAIACTKGSEESKLLEDLVKRNKRMVEAPKPQQFFHCEYTIAPDHESTVADIVTYGVAAKVFTETDSKVVKTWDEGQVTWVAWVHSHDILITDENIHKLYDHTLEFKLWDSKDKVSAKARFDRPKAFRLPSSKGGAPGKGVAAVVAKQSRSWTNLQPRDSNTKCENADEQEKLLEPERTPTPAKVLEHARVRSSLGRLAGLSVPDQDKKRINELKMQQAKLMKQLNKQANEHTDSPRQSGNNAGIQAPDSSQTKRKYSESSRVKTLCVPIKMELLFAGMKEVTSRIIEPSVNVKDMFVTVSVGGDFMPQRVEQELNPLVINIKSVKSLPDAPISRDRLSMMCQPIYCSYKFPDHPIHKTSRRPHTKDVYFEDIHVILAGKLNPGKLFEFLHCDGLVIEIHDRDRKLPDTAKPPLIFGDDSDDKQLGNVGLVTSKRTTHNAFQDRSRVYDPYGVARVCLDELLRGQKTLNFMVIVNPCRIPDLLHNPNNFDQEAKIVGVVGAVDRPENPPLAAGDYLNAGTVLKIKVSLKYPLTWHPSPSNEMLLSNESCPFSRVIYYFNYENKKLLKKLESFVTKTNTKALGLDQFEKHVVEVALSTYKLTAEQRENEELDVITGFHVIDGYFHMLVLEGLQNHAISKLHREIGRMPPEDGGFVTMLYDSSISFNSRIYADLDVNLCTIRLHQPLKKILEQPLLYVRDLVPRPCFQCLVLIKQISEVHRLRDVCHNNIFPDHEMVISMSREFGIPLVRGDYEDHHRVVDKTVENKENEPTIQSTSEIQSKEGVRRWTPIDHSNMEFEKYLSRRKKAGDFQPDYVLGNIVSVQKAGRRKRPHETMVFADVKGLPHNYSTQTLNSTELSKNALRKMLFERNKDIKYAYNEIYNSAMVAPINEDEFYQQQEEMIKNEWRTKLGFIFPGVKSSLLSNVHSMRPDDSRVQELKLKWRENTLHAHVLNPTLKRDIWSWALRHQDLNLYTKPKDRSQDLPLSIHLPGDKREMEEEYFRRQAARQWKSKVVVDEERMRFHRVLCNTEQTNQSNQVDKLQGILKDEPKKTSLKFFPSIKIPPLSVVSYPSIDREACDQGKKILLNVSKQKYQSVGLQPGPFNDVSWNMDKNTIQIRDPEHEKFAKLKGKDFTTFLKDREYLCKNPIHPLLETEKEYELFHVVSPPIAPKKRVKPRVEEEEEFVDNRKSEYRTEYTDIEGHWKRRPILPQHKFHGLSHVITSGSFRSDASVQLMGTHKNVNS